MVLTVKHKYILYRRFQHDIWGYCYTDERGGLVNSGNSKFSFQTTEMLKRQVLKSPYLSFFYKLWLIRRQRLSTYRKRYIYMFSNHITSRPRHKWRLRFISIRLTRLYFLTFQDYQFRKLFRKAARLDGNYEKNYLCFLRGVF
jgi:hypothetical protein